ncbi:MAG: hypothetical protein MUF64_19055 [Polyangiaceae bacterium]|nr:hypothetical protein [Polyangiaceae bacterium]
MKHSSTFLSRSDLASMIFLLLAVACGDSASSDEPGSMGLGGSKAGPGGQGQGGEGGAEAGAAGTGGGGSSGQGGDAGAGAAGATGSSGTSGQGGAGMGGAGTGGTGTGGAGQGGGGVSGTSGQSGAAGMGAVGGAPDCSNFVVPLPEGWVRSNITSTSQVIGIEGGVPWLPFPQSGNTGLIITDNEKYHAIGFDTPSEPWGVTSYLFIWQEAQQFGAVDLSNVYISITSCPGDFRLPPPGQTAPADDPTFARGCRNIRSFPGFPQDMVTSKIDYVVSEEPSSEEVCRLAPGRKYYINFIRANAADGEIGPPSSEATCKNPEQTSCGVQMRYF